MLKLSFYKQVKKNYQPKKNDIEYWLKQSLTKPFKNIFLNISIVSKKTSQELNLQFRQKNFPTNVISLEYSDTRQKYNILMGELILCDDIIVEEAKANYKPIIEHYAHMVVHGLLHLQGFDHINDIDANSMEKLEIEILDKFGIKNPYIKMRD